MRKIATMLGVLLVPASVARVTRTGEKKAVSLSDGRLGRLCVHVLAPASAVAALIIVAGSLTAGCGTLAGLWDDGPCAAPACSWPLRVSGHATAAQTGLIRCYLQAVAQHDLGALKGLAAPGWQVTSAQLAQTADARAGLATATVAMSQEDTGIGTVQIDYADGATCSFGIEIVNPSVAGSWRLDIGSAAPGPRGPSPATARTA